jgi:hypothetical protein
LRYVGGGPKARPCQRCSQRRCPRCSAPGQRGLTSRQQRPSPSSAFEQINARAQLEGNPGWIEHYAETRARQARRRRQEALAMEREIWDEVMKDNASTGVNGDGVRRVTGKSKKPRKSKKK